MEISRSIFVHWAVLAQPQGVADLIYLGAEETVYMRQDCSPGRRPICAGFALAIEWSHAFKLINALFGVSWPDLSKGLVLVSSCSHVLRVDHVVHRFLGLVPSIGQLWAESLETQSQSHSLNTVTSHNTRLFWRITNTIFQHYGLTRSELLHLKEVFLIQFHSYSWKLHYTNRITDISSALNSERHVGF